MFHIVLRMRFIDGLWHIKMVDIMSVCWWIIIIYALIVYDVYIDNILIFTLHAYPHRKREIGVFTIFKYVGSYVVLYGRYTMSRRTVEFRLRDSLMMGHIVMSPICLNVDSLNMWHILYLIQITIYLRYSLSFVRISVKRSIPIRKPIRTPIFLMCLEIEFNENVLFPPPHTIIYIIELTYCAGKPKPRLQWYSADGKVTSSLGTRKIMDLTEEVSYGNENDDEDITTKSLVIHQLNRNHANSTYTCLAGNDDNTMQSNLQMTVQINMYRKYFICPTNYNV